MGIACSDISETLQEIRRLFVVTGATAIIHDPEQNANLCMLYLESGPPLELIEGIAVANIVKKGLHLYHTCWEVDDIDAAISVMCCAGCRLISPPKKAVLFNYRRVAFLYSGLGLIEIIENPGE
jgi:methylmalonyl-CoA/ethylmalonyl-CoA epimerase